MTSEPLYSMDLREQKKNAYKIAPFYEKKTKQTNWLIYQKCITSVPEDLCGHDKTWGFRTDLDITCQESNIPKGVFEVSELLIGQGFNRRSVDGPVTNNIRNSSSFFQ